MLSCLGGCGHAHCCCPALSHPRSCPLYLCILVWFSAKQIHGPRPLPCLAVKVVFCILRQSLQDADRVESGKAGAIAAVGGLGVALPLLLTAPEGSAAAGVSGALGLAATVVSCILFGVTYR